MFCAPTASPLPFTRCYHSRQIRDRREQQHVDLAVPSAEPTHRAVFRSSPSSRASSNCPQPRDDALRSDLATPASGPKMAGNGKQRGSPAQRWRTSGPAWIRRRWLRHAPRPPAHRRVRSHLLRVLAFDHHAHQRLGSRRAQQHTTGSGQRVRSVSPTACVTRANRRRARPGSLALTLTSDCGNFSIPVAQALPATCRRPSSRTSTCSADTMPSPVVLRSRHRMCPDPSPPTSQLALLQLFENVAVADLRSRERNRQPRQAPVPGRSCSSPCRRHRRPSDPPAARCRAMMNSNSSPSSTTPLLIDHQHAVAVAVEGDTQIGAVAPALRSAAAPDASSRNRR